MNAEVRELAVGYARALQGYLAGRGEDAIGLDPQDARAIGLSAS